jgi:hypothetical protein
MDSSSNKKRIVETLFGRRWRRSAVLLALFILFLTWFFTPRALSHDVRSQLALIHQLNSKPSHAFTYLIGMSAPAGVDPMDYGRELLPQYIASSGYGANSPHTAPISTNLVSVSPLDCSLFKDSQCIDLLFTAHDARTQTLAKYPDRVPRYQAYKSYADYHVPYPMNVGSFQPAFTMIIGGQKVFLMQQVDALTRGEISPAQLQQNILDDLAYWRTELVAADSVMYTMTVVRLMNNDLNMLAKIYQRYNLHAPEIALLSVPERSMRLSNATETSINHAMLSDMRAQHTHCAAKGWMACFDRVVDAVTFDHNATLNQMSKARTKQLQLAELPQDVAYLHRDDDPDEIGIGQWIRNSAGAELAQMAQKNMSQYVFRVDDLNLKIALLNASAKQPAGSTDPLWLVSIQNPYGLTAGHAFIDNDGVGKGWLCLKTTVKEENLPLNGCIPWLADNAPMGEVVAAS